MVAGAEANDALADGFNYLVESIYLLIYDCVAIGSVNGFAIALISDYNGVEPISTTEEVGRFVLLDYVFESLDIAGNVTVVEIKEWDYLDCLTLFVGDSLCVDYHPLPRVQLVPNPRCISHNGGRRYKYSSDHIGDIAL